MYNHLSYAEAVMKLALHLLIPLCVFAPLLHAQDWKLVESGVTDNLYDIFFVNKHIGWAVGTDSTIIKTTDEGATWFQQTGGYAEEYRCVYFLDEQRGWIGGTGGLVLHTTDGGESWEKQETELLDTVNDIDFVNDSVGWLTGEITLGGCGHWSTSPSGAVLKTSNAGDDWHVQLQTCVKDTVDDENKLEGRLNAIDFISEDYGCVGGDWLSDIDFPGCVICTDDGGQNWYNYPNGFYQRTSRYQWVYAIKVLSPDSMYVGTRGALFSTVDSGKTVWVYKEPPAKVFDLAVPSINHVYSLAGRDGIMRVKYYQNDEREGEWQTLEGDDFGGPGYTSNYMGLCMIDTATGWICGDGGKLWTNNPNLVSVEELRTVPELYLSHNYPNPFNPSTEITYGIPQDGDVKLTVFDNLGREVEVLVDSYKNAGTYTVQFNAEDQPSGMYLYRIETASGTLSKKMVLMK